MERIITSLLLLVSISFFGQQILTQSQEIRTDDLYFGVSQTPYNFGTTIPISAKFGAWNTNTTFNYNAAGTVFNRWLGSATLFSNAYIGQAYSSTSPSLVGIAFDVSITNSKGAKPIRRMFISPYGNIGIGTQNPDEKLTVKGKIHAEEVRVDLNVAPDYVFQKYYTGSSKLNDSYQMPTLAEVEKFTKKNHHLPEVPSAKEIKENGLHLKQMASLLLQKVEELTLYTIEQEKRIKALESKLVEKKK
ncbi:hypothetical protein [Polaribacter cellanae]|uniref:Peptidase S74 domain-containing protein n=1 Tax=Polaribacter cellanae TaxID=2818493 RepID=A0A975CLN7_9FLAO|nr:hypothetical protein [Polaribacter cellanae]QTE21505.1 hypothetical protein J3359_11800 [Polaribacter cellanae]